MQVFNAACSGYDYFTSPHRRRACENKSMGNAIQPDKKLRFSIAYCDRKQRNAHWHCKRRSTVLPQKGHMYVFFGFLPNVFMNSRCIVGCVHKRPSRRTYGLLCAYVAVCARVCCRDRLSLELVHHITEDDWNSSCSSDMCKS